ncbi:hypothetical protein JYK00_04630 [Thermosipho ferrireducens]|uniref:Uncharacterized protein n=1 Tax=Thermosipho ferrireducens TaxID=2571116 RepID=A0ABX7S878_9BACT|nr:hypothetical protein [Thermosipho ferrireducens]QTA38797.1 hypothetical protein JYK00_04630 [Thermosipho ferrireducens]
MRKLIEDIFVKPEYKELYKTSIGFIEDLKSFSKELKIGDGLWNSKQGEREKRPVIVENSGNNCKIMFLSTKNYSKIKVDIWNDCNISSDEFCKFQQKPSYVFEYNHRYVFLIPKELLKRFFTRCGVCKKCIKDFLLRWY